MCVYTYRGVRAYARIFSSTCTCYSLAFRQPATGPSSVCEGSNVTLQCVIILNLNDNITIARESVWTRNGILATNISNHRFLFNSTTGGFTGLVITNVTLADDNSVYTCTDTIATITSSVVLNVTGNYCMYVLCYSRMVLCKNWAFCDICEKSMKLYT